ncbi:MAG: hypothetical protein K2J71_10690 [Oscillospiraceae bacterium]|nr:hypothetical protein [Oscillospiraceae bacterium]
MKKYICFDPAVLNDNGVIRLYYGTQYPYEEEYNLQEHPELVQKESEMFGKSPEEILNTPESVMGASMCILGADMMTVIEPARHIIPYAVRNTSFAEHPFFEGASMRKIGNTYYFIYSSLQNHELCYAVSDYPDRDFIYKGVIISNGDIGYQGITPENRLNMTGTTHGSMINIQDQYYIFYHRLTHKSDYSRQACAERITIQPDGTIPQTEMTSCGLNNAPLEANGIYPAVIACNLTNGHMPHGSNAIFTEHFPHVTHDSQDRFIAEIADHTLIGYKYFKFSGRETIRIRYRSTGTGMFLLYDNPEANSLGQLPVAICDQWQDVQTVLQIQKGIRALYFCYAGQGEVSLLEFELIPEKQDAGVSPESEQKSSLFAAMAVIATVMLFLASGFFINRVHADKPELEIPETIETEKSTEYQKNTESTESSYKIQSGNIFSDLPAYPSGDYIIGKDIPAGLYLLIADTYNYDNQDSGEYEDYGDFYFEVYQDAKISSSKLRADWVQNSHYLELENGQHLHFSHAELYHVSENQKLLPDVFSKSGMYQVGRDLAPGNYEILANLDYGGGYAVYDSAKPGAVPVMESGYLNIGESKIIQLAEGQFLEMSFCKIQQTSEENPGDNLNLHFYAEGAYLIGKDLPAGLYILKSADYSSGNGIFQVEVYAENTLDKSAVIGGFSRNFRYVDLQDGQYLVFSDAELYPVRAKSAPLGDPYQDPGMYLVGRDLPAGTYTVEMESGIPGDFGMMTVYDSAGAEAELLFSGLIRSETGTLEVHDGEFLEMRNCHLKS